MAIFPFLQFLLYPNEQVILQSQLYLWSVYHCIHFWKNEFQDCCVLNSTIHDRNTWKGETITYLSFHFGPALLLLFAFSHVFVLLLSLGERLQELVKDAKELVRLHLAGILAEVIHRLQELWDQRGRGGIGLDLLWPCLTRSVTV